MSSVLGLDNFTILCDVLIGMVVLAFWWFVTCRLLDPISHDIMSSLDSDYDLSKYSFVLRYLFVSFCRIALFLLFNITWLTLSIATLVLISLSLNALTRGF